MRRSSTTSGAILVGAAMLVASSSFAQAAGTEPDPGGLVTGPGYVIVGPGEPGPVETDAGTLVVVRNDDGSLPGGISIGELDELMQAQENGDYATIERYGFEVAGAHSAPASDSTD